jgi:hypothetical protein
MKNSNAIRKLKSLGFCLALFAGLFIGSCSDVEDDVPPSTTTAKVPYVCSTCPSSSEANVGNDNNENGIYKGVFLGGTVDINFRNNQEQITGKVYYNNKTIDLYESPEVILADGRRVQAFLRGRGENSSAALLFSVNDDGSAPEVGDFSLSEEEPSVSCMIFKEKSKMLLETFEGNYYSISDNNVPSGPTSSEINYKIAEPDPEMPGNAVGLSSVRLIVSRSDKMWVMFSAMASNSGSPNFDHGKIVDSYLRSDITGKAVARLAADELNHRESTDSGILYLHAQRRR